MNSRGQLVVNTGVGLGLAGNAIQTTVTGPSQATTLHGIANNSSGVVSVAVAAPITNTASGSLVGINIGAGLGTPSGTLVSVVTAPAQGTTSGGLNNTVGTLSVVTGTACSVNVTTGQLNVLVDNSSIKVNGSNQLYSSSGGLITAIASPSPFTLTSGTLGFSAANTLAYGAGTLYELRLEGEEAGVLRAR